MEKSRTLALGATGLFVLTGCLGSTSAEEGVDQQKEDPDGVDALLAGYEQEGGSCGDPDPVEGFSDLGEAVECSGGVVLFHWDEPAEGIGEESEYALEMFAAQERYLVLEDTWAISVEGEDSADWIVDNLGGEIQGPEDHMEYASALRLAHEECESLDFGDSLSYDEDYDVITISGAYQQQGNSVTSDGYMAGLNFSCIADETDMPEYVRDRIDATSAMQGRQDESWGDLAADWSYHPNNGLDITFRISED